MQIIDYHCWLIFFASIVTALAATCGLVAESYKETLPENIGLAAVAVSGFITAAQIWDAGYAHISGLTAQSVSIAWYASALVFKHHRGFA